MSVHALLLSRRAELRRRVEALRSEIDEWKTRAQCVLNDALKSFEAHSSQIQAIDVIVTALIQTQRDLLKDRAGKRCSRLQRQGFQLGQHIIKAQRVWDFFRDKLSWFPL